MNKLFLLGDSTCAKKETLVQPETGWGECFSPYLKEGWCLVNLAKNGRSTEMILREGIFLDCYYALSPGDYVMIQFGHNESKKEEYRHTEPLTSFKENLKYITYYLQKRGAKVIFISPIARRNFISGHMVDTHLDYPLAMEGLAKELNIPFIEMSQRTLNFLDKIGEEESLKYFMNFPPNTYPNYPNGNRDNTHLRVEGAELIASMIAHECIKSNFPFMNDVKD